ncbi:MAG: diguanylate cyclase [Candidatus Omnitrophica bacterium]|nr:diguanylate cyclase [Candidatus Omnitrophota bacterium]
MKLSFIRNIREFIYGRTFKHRYRISWVLAFAVAAIVIFLYQFDIFERLELLTLDYRFMLRPAKPITSEIVFIDMSEDSIESIGRWPWPRIWHATLIKALSDYHPKAIVFDVLFTEPQDTVNDTAMEEAMNQSGVVYLPLLFDLKWQDAANLYKGGGVVSEIRPLPRFAEYAKGIGHINAIPDVDGVLRRIPPVITYKNSNIFQMGLRVGLDASGVNMDEISFYPDKHLITAKVLGGKMIKIPLDEKNQCIINWRARWGKEFKHYSYIDVIRSYSLIKRGLSPIIDLNEFRDKICIVGLTAAGLIDIKPIPLQNAYPAVGVNAMMASSAINRSFVRDTPRVYTILLIILLPIIVTLYLSNLRLLSGMALATLSMFGYALLSVLVFNIFNLAIPTFYPLLAIGLSYSISSLYAQVLHSFERASLFKQATRDGLTNLYNIRHFNLLLEAEFRNVSMYKARKLAIIMGDVDNFKQINDTYGHQAGDAILRDFARIIESKCRQIDVVARYGGEEFIVMLTGAGQKDAAIVAEKIREAVSSKKFKAKSGAYGTTISLGVAEFVNERDKEELIAKADKALYKAKFAGKNRVCIG